MRHVFEHRDKASEKASRAMKWVRTQTWQRMAVEFMKQIINLYPPVPNRISARELNKEEAAIV